MRLEHPAIDIATTGCRPFVSHERTPIGTNDRSTVSTAFLVFLLALRG